MNDSTATKLIAAASAVGVTALMVGIFVFTTRSKDPRDEKLLSVEVGDLLPSHYLSLETEALHYFVIRPDVGEIYVVAAPVVEGGVPMPETYWWKPIVRCKSFGLDSTTTAISAESKFVCRDGGQPEPWARRWQWDIRGKHVPDTDNTPVDDLYRVRVKRSGDEIVFVGLETA